MPIRTECQSCRAVFVAQDEHAGKRGKCPACKAPIQVPDGPAVSRQALKSRTGDASKSAAGTRQSSTAHASHHPPVPAKQQVPQRQPSDAEQRAIARQSLLAAFQGEMRPVKVPILYRVGIVLSAIIMLLLPLAYLGVIVLAGAAVYYHATQHTGLLQMGTGRGRLMAVLIYVAPIFAGVVLVFFMLKPLFASPLTTGRTRSLTRQGEPLLFAFVERICEILGAPMPARIDVDWQLNASAHLDGGWLRLVRNRLVLSIGAPLVANLDAAEFAGVLAHEFGHFTQGVALRMTFVVRSINLWFARVVYQRDTWDEWLEETANELDWRVGFVLQLARLSVWLSRRVLWVFMILGCLVSNFLLRQMEYHADAHEARLVGAKVFESTTRKLAVLSALYQVTLHELGIAVDRGQLPNDLSAYMGLKQCLVPSEAIEAITRHAFEQKTGLFDTHPADKDRVRRAQREGAGLFADQRPAASLFSDFKSMSRGTTGDLYRAVFGNRFQPSRMQAIEEKSPVDRSEIREIEI